LPYPNSHAARLRNPDDCDKDTYRTTAGGTIYGKIKVPVSINVIWAKLKTANKPDDFPVPQTLRFDKSKWTEAQAKKWLEDNKLKIIKFEPATKEHKSIEVVGIKKIVLPFPPVQETEGGKTEKPVKVEGIKVLSYDIGSRDRFAYILFQLDENLQEKYTTIVDSLKKDGRYIYDQN